MNAPAEAPETLNLAAPPATVENDGEESDESSPSKNGHHRSKGKIARLPKSLRQTINTMLDDGASYPAIILKLQESTDPPLPYAISAMNISRWKDYGYQRYLTHQEHVDFVRSNREDALDLIAEDDTITLPEATLQIIASQYYELLGDFSPGALKVKLAEDPLKYTRFLNVFARLTREILNLKKHRQASASAAALELKHLDPEREFSDSEDQAITDRMDDFFKKPRRRPQPESAGKSTSAPKL